MVVALVGACAKQHAGIPFGPGDIKGSFTSLISRGLIVKKEAHVNNRDDSTWLVTTEAIEMLASMGIETLC